MYANLVCSKFGMAFYETGVFYCGNPVLTRELGNLAREFSRKTNTKFDFHKENF